MNKALQAERTLAAVLRDMILERQRLLIREASFLRGLVVLPPVRAGSRQADKLTKKPRTSGGHSGDWAMVR